MKPLMSLNKPARPDIESAMPAASSSCGKSTRTDVQVSDTVCWYVWDGGFMAMGRAQGVVPRHAHHAIQIVVALEGEIAVQDEDEVWRSARGIVVGPDREHCFDGKGALAAMFLIDPESTEGVWLRASLQRDVTIMPEGRVAACVAELARFRDHPLESLEIGALIRHCVQALSAGALPARRLDPRVTKVLQQIQRSDDLRLSLAAAAKSAFLSPSRFQHLFKQQMGLPFRRYVLWRKLARAMVAMGREGTATAAAHAADFADAAHLTRTFIEMFGIPPTVMLRGVFFEIPSPFAGPS
ncbi:AraC family transcriptional regulator [Horticoccus luteus]|uniref:AraC family transcriptional regulator n=1 Tax=Horticoccus luteus TaxID=2862869 RepID=A0A8F9TVI7_9BACT|nr:helix-turn-helix domain-containing protein [Horticoccus luteus]QYM78362.1 AraC family transcriptional regulator [Horticoccus luteus]